MKKLITYSVLAILLLALYFLFEPIFLHNIGQQKTPNLESVETINTSSYLGADKLLKQHYLKLKTPGLSIAVGMHNQIIWSNSIGYSDIDNNIKIDSLTKFRIGSVSKALTSSAVGMLLQQNKLNLNSTIKDYVPYSSDKLSELTLKQVASHTTGIRNYGTCLCFPIWEFYNNDAYESIEESVGIFNNDNLLFKPGTNFSYSSYNYTLLSAMIEGASNDNFLNFMQKNIFDPLNLNHTGADKIGSYDTNVATFYDINEGNYKPSYNINNSNKWAGGGFLSTPRDLVTYGNAMLSYQLIDSTTTNLLFSPVKLENGKINKQRYALGWRNHMKETIFKDKRKARIVHHGGVSAGSTALLVLFPEYNTTIAITMNKNSESFNLFETAYEFADLFITKYKNR